MISDEEVTARFRNALASEGEYGGFGSLQIYHGNSDSLWKDAHPGGCARHMTVFKQYRAIPQYCFDCYKVFVEPRSVLELFKLLMVFEEIALPGNNTRKCMAEGRDDCSGTYKGYVYCRGLEEGREVRKIVRKAVTEAISPGVGVTLKRGCSEYAQAYPAYGRVKLGVAAMPYRMEWRAFEEQVDRDYPNVPGQEVLRSLPRGESGKISYTPAEIFAMNYWLSYAATIGDHSCLRLAGRTLAKLSNVKRPPFRSTAPYVKSR